MNDATQSRADSMLAKPCDGHCGQYLTVRNMDSVYRLSLLTRGRECEGLIPNASSFARIVSDLTGLPLSLCAQLIAFEHRLADQLAGQFTALCFVHFPMHAATAIQIFDHIQVVVLSNSARGQIGDIPHPNVIWFGRPMGRWNVRLFTLSSATML
ncbi:MAG: hypothetical protein ACI9PZ_000431 [Parvicella sp.]|jgi:hypothetical protein